MWFMEEVGELSLLLRGGETENLATEFADVLAWLATLANIAKRRSRQGHDAKYGKGCPGCGRLPCSSGFTEKP